MDSSVSFSTEWKVVSSEKPSTSVEDAVVTVASSDPLYYRLADDLAVFAMVVKAIIEIVFAL